MMIERGKGRTVLVFRGFVVKLAMIHPLLAVKTVFRYASKGYLLECLKWDTYAIGSPRRLLLRGITENWREFILYCQCRSPFLMPTYLSLFGLLNIQKAGCILTDDDVDPWSQLFEITNGGILDDRHTFEATGNFCIENGKLRIVDYGSIRAHRVLRQYGNKIYYQLRV